MVVPNSNDDDDSRREEPVDGGVNGDGPSSRRTRSRRMQKQFWIDGPFRERVRRLARRRGKTLPEVMDFAGVAVDYAYKPAEARNTNVIMALAECLDVTPTELCGWPAPPAKAAPAPKKEPEPEMPPEVRRLQPLLTLFSEQTAALVRALEPPKLPAPTAMLQLFYEQTEALLLAMNPDLPDATAMTAPGEPIRETQDEEQTSDGYSSSS